MAKYNLGGLELKQICIFIMACLLIYCSNALSEVYRWTDANGQVHFGDRAPAGEHSDNISRRLDNINISTDLSSPELMLKQAEQKEARQNEKRQKLIALKKKLPSISEVCINARRYLSTIEGRVVFTDENGNEVKVTEQERKNEALTLKKMISQKCS
ncbi:MAG: hypothetical protein ACJASG_000811 [Oleiphilaceae bacterium]|jgi:hypothetical protein